MNKKENIGCLIGIIIIVLVIAGLIGLYVWKGPPATLTAKEACSKASEYIKAKDTEAYLVSLAYGYIPESVGRVSDLERTGKGINWYLCFYLKKEDKWIKLATSWKGEIEEKETTLYSCTSKEKIDSEKWKIDSQQAIEIARNKAKEEGKKRFVPIKIELYQSSKEGPTWSVIFFPPNVGKDTVGFNVYINGETGEVIRTGEPGYHYLVI